MKRKVLNCLTVLFLIFFVCACFNDNNEPPIANAGSSQTAAVGDTVSLDGSKSSDPDDSEIYYQWAVINPDGSIMQLSNASSDSPTFIPTIPASYSVSLVVIDADGLESEVSTCTITVEELQITNCSPNNTTDVPVNPTVFTWDCNGQNAAYSVYLTIDGEESLIYTGYTQTAKKITEHNSNYSWRVTAAQNGCAADSELMSFQTKSNSAPIANAGADITTAQCDIISLDGSSSADDDGGSLTYSWYMDNNSNCTLINTSSQNPTFTSTVPGTYTVSLKVNDGSQESAPDSVMITVEELSISNMFPTGGNAATDTEIRWQCNSENAIYNVYLSNTEEFSNDPTEYGIAENSYYPEELNLGETYYCKVIAINGNCSTIEIWDFTTGANQWEMIGLEDHSIKSITAHPSDPNCLYVGTNGQGLKMSVDGGITWQNVSSMESGSIQKIIISQTDPNVIYIASLGQGIFRSINGGDTWTDTNFPEKNVTAIAFVPDEETTIIASTIFKGIYKTIDAGLDWYNVYPNSSSTANSIAFTENGNIYAATGNFGVLKSDDNGESFAEFNDGLDSKVVWSIASAGENSLVCGVEQQGAYYTDGDYWLPKTSGLNIQIPITAFVIAGDTTYASNFGEGVWKTPDYENWTDYNQGLTEPRIWTIESGGTNLYAGTVMGIWRIKVN